MGSELESEFLGAVEEHFAPGIRNALRAGLDANAPIDGRSPVQWLLEMYTRSPRFPQCLQTLLDGGAVFADAALKAVLLDDAASLRQAIGENRSILESRVTLRNAFTALEGVSLLHVAAEYGNANAARQLIEAGANPDMPAATDADGLGAHTAIFHTVNSPHNHCEPVLRLLLDAGARCDVQAPALVWGRGFEWETIVFDVTPISYAMMGLLRQFHRNEQAIHANVECMLHSSGRIVPGFENVPNRYVAEMTPRRDDRQLD